MVQKPLTSGLDNMTELLDQLRSCELLP